jgi:hypothetical protein
MSDNFNLYPIQCNLDFPTDRMPLFTDDPAVPGSMIPAVSFDDIAINHISIAA